MARIGFICLGNMGLPMAQNLIKAGHQVEGVDVNPAAIAKLKAAGGSSVETAKIAAARADVVITMLPSGKEVREIYLGVLDRVRGTIGPVRALLDRLRRGSFRQVERCHVMLRLAEIGCHRAAHVAKTDEGDFRHGFLR